MSEKTAYYWLTSMGAEAVNWRAAASGETFLKMVNRCVDDHKREQGALFTIPPAEIEAPPVRKGRFFDIPQLSVKGKVGRFFTIPPISEEA